ncbi:MAG TPA: glycosyltransferase family 39 protein [Candidatus Woesebacteria bacterium]|nr:glycosyltransferase family 39 protein [Candidatus Woesebacteria bacterium]
MAIIIAVFFWLRLFHLEERMNFSMDQGLFSLRASEIWENKEISLIGPEASMMVEGKHFFQGPATYYLSVVLMLLGNWDPVRAGVGIVILNGLGLIFLYLTLKIWFKEEEAKIGIILFTFLPLSIKYSNFIWNPNFLLIFCSLFLYIFSKAVKNNKFIWYGLAGLMAGICWQFHYQFTLVIIGSLMFLVFRKTNFKNIFIYILGILIGFWPLIVFEFRNNFYNLGLIIKWLTINKENHFKLEEHYLIGFLPIVIAILVYLFKRINRVIVYFLMAVVIVMGVRFSLKTEEWNYKDKIKVVNLIKQKGCENFEIAQTITGDTRSYDLRYLLKINQCQPLEVDKYPEAKKLYLISKKQVEEESVWEVRSMEKFEIMSKTIINNQIMLYELVKKN